MDPRIKQTKKEHYLYQAQTELEIMMKKHVPGYLEYVYKPTFGKWHYHYSYEDKKISLIETQRGFSENMLWEICSGGTCKGCHDCDELFKTKEEAEARIEELLVGKK